MTRTVGMAVRNLLARPARTLLTLFGILLGVSVIIAVSITPNTNSTMMRTMISSLDPRFMRSA